MSTPDLEALRKQWFPVAASREVERRAICHVKLLDQELAVWRSDDGQANAWENRCAHRSVRLTIGLNLGSELQCRYHGWRYASGTGQCSRIPAHPNLIPAKSICIKRFPAQERYGFVWSSIGEPAGLPEICELEDAQPLTLRSLPIHVAANELVAALARDGLGFATCAGDGLSSSRFDVTRLGSYVLRASFRGSSAMPIAMLFVQVVEPGKAILHGCLIGEIRPQETPSLLRSFNESMTILRRRLETTTGGLSATVALTGDGVDQMRKSPSEN